MGLVLSWLWRMRVHGEGRGDASSGLMSFEDDVCCGKVRECGCEGLP
jgi:hypothetical protein